MTDATILDMLREALWACLSMATPMLLAALTLGVIVGLFQALTSIQELTLTFVPKLAAMGVVFWVSMDFMGHTVISLFQDRIIPIVAGG